jgi:hypothetical protein
MEQATSERLDDIALTEAAFIALKQEDYWDRVVTDRSAAERELQDALYNFCPPECADCELRAERILCGTIDSPMSQAAQAIEEYHVAAEKLHEEDDAERDALSDHWRGCLHDEAQKMIDALRKVRRAKEVEAA